MNTYRCYLGDNTSILIADGSAERAAGVAEKLINKTCTFVEVCQSMTASEAIIKGWKVSVPAPVR